MGVEIEDENRVPEVMRELKILQGAEIKVGIFAPEGSETFIKAAVNEFGAQITVTEAMQKYLAAKSHELGLNKENGGLFLKVGSTINIPERSYLRSFFDENYKEIVRDFEEGFIAVMKGAKSAKQLLHEIGTDLEKAVKERIKKVDTPENHPFTTAKKGFNNPLIQSGDLRDKIEYRIN